MPRAKKETGGVDDDAAPRVELERVRAGAYRTPDERFTVEQESGRWLLLDAEQVDELGLPLVRGPFDTLDAVKAAISDVRSGPAPRSPLEARLKEAAARPAPASPASLESAVPGPGRRPAPKRTTREQGSDESAMPGEAPSPVPIIVRRLGPRDESILRSAATDPELVQRGIGLAREASAAGEGDASGATERPEVDRSAVRRLLARTDAHVLVALEGKTVLGILTASERPRFRGGPSVLLVDDLAIREGRDARDIGGRLLDGLPDLARERHALRVDVPADGADPVARALLEERSGARVDGDRVLYRLGPPGD